MLKRIFANVLDQIIVFVVSVLLLLLLQVIMKAVGFKIVEPAAFLLIMYAIINVFYFPIIEGSKYGTTIGKRLLKLDE